MFRFISRFCTSDMDHKELFEYYVRKGCEKGGLVFSDTETGETLSFILNSAGRFLVYSDGKTDKVDFYTEEEIDETLLERFGILVDDSNNFVVNVFGRDNIGLGVSTSQLLNGAILDRVLIGRDVERVTNFLKQQETDLRDFIKANVIKKDYYKNRLQNTAYVEEEFLRFYSILSKDITLFCSKISLVEKETKQLVQSLSKPVIPPPPKTSEELRTMLTLLDSLTDMQQEASRVKKIDVDIESIAAKREYLCKLQALTGYLYAIGEVIKEVADVNAPEEPRFGIRQSDMVEAAKLLGFMQELHTTAQLVMQKARENRDNELVLAEKQERLAELKKKLKVCPTCGSEFGG